MQTLPLQPPPPHVVLLTPGPAPQWQGQWPDRVATHIQRAELHHYPAPGTPRGRVLVCPGGGYLQLVHDKEGVEIALWLNRLGLDAWVLLHRLPGQPVDADAHADADGVPPLSPLAGANTAPATPAVWPADVALHDGLLALDHLDQLDQPIQPIQPKPSGQADPCQPPGPTALPLLLLGLSSGGHLAGTLACQPRPRPACGALMAYAPLNANHRQHKAPAGKPDYPPPEKQAFYDAWPVGLTALPHGLPRMPLFLACALHDQAVPVDHALNLLRSAAQAGLDVDAHVFAQAPHGFALRSLNGRHDQWPSLAARWMDERLAAAGQAVSAPGPGRP